MTTTRNTIDDLRAINARFIHNFITHDVEGHAALLHEDFLAIQSDGSTLNRATYLREWATGFDPDVIPYWDTRDEQITVVGDVALVRSTNCFVVVRDGVQTWQASRYTDTYLLTDDGWRCIQAQITPVQSHDPTDMDGIVSVYRRGLKQEA
ncbi:MAG: nuclear transport factor 2 family protein [Knoellia sp.]